MPLQTLTPRTSAHRAAAHAIQRAVMDGELAVGERLPSERELATTLGVSRLTLRAALASLTAQGLLTVKHGRGYVVQDYTRTGGADLLSGLATHAPPIARQLLRVRRHLGRAVLEHLCEHPPVRASLVAYDAAVAAMAAMVAREASPAELARADLDVVRALIDASRSPVFALCMNHVIAVIADSDRLRRALYATPATNVDGWRALGMWLRKPRPESLEPLLAVLARHDEATLERLRRQR